MTTAKPREYLTVPAGSRPANCKACDCLIYFVEHKPGKYTPVDCEADAQCAPPTRESEGVGVSHFTTCTDPQRFSRRRA